MKLNDSALPLLILILNSLILTFSLNAQTEPEEILLEEQNETAASELLERLQFLRQHPLDINRAPLQDLQLLPFITPMQAKEIISERLKKGDFKSWADFEHRMHFEKELYKMLSQYLTIVKKESNHQRNIKIRWRYQDRFPKSLGYTKKVYPGSSYKGYQRMILTLNPHMTCGLLIEKDPGELQWSDHFVAFLKTDYLPILSQLLIGNYRIEVGQGLVFWGPYGFSKGANPITPVKKQSVGALGYTYSDENDYLTGAAVEIKNRVCDILAFVSNSHLDATLNAYGIVTSIPSSGFHRTPSEREKKNCLRESIIGGRMTKKWALGTIGLTSYSSHYSNQISKTNPTRNRFDFQGQKNHVIGFDYDIYVNRINISGELARSRSNGWATIGNCILQLDHNVFIVSYRIFTPDFQNPHSHSFGYNQISNQEGFYFGLIQKLDSTTRLNFYYDFYRKPWRTYTIPVPTNSDDLFIQIEKKLSSYLKITLRTRFQNQEVLENGTTNTGITIDFLQKRIHNLYRLELQFVPTRRLRIKSRLETVRVDYPNSNPILSNISHDETGVLLYNDLLIRPKKGLSISARWITFDTKSYDSRIYEFENDLPGVLTIHPLYQEGTRWYLLIRWEIWQMLQISAKFSTSYHKGVDTWGSGYDRIQGNKEGQFAIQADIKF